MSYEGATQILDAPVGAVLQALLPKAPALKAALAPYRAAAPASPFQQDLFALGAILYEMLTLEPLAGGARPCRGPGPGHPQGGPGGGGPARETCWTS